MAITQAQVELAAQSFTPQQIQEAIAYLEGRTDPPYQERLAVLQAAAQLQQQPTATDSQAGASSADSSLDNAVQRLDANPIIQALFSGKITYAQALQLITQINQRGGADNPAVKAERFLREQGFGGTQPPQQVAPLPAWSTFTEGQVWADSGSPTGYWKMVGGQARPSDQYGRVSEGYGPSMGTVSPGAPPPGGVRPPSPAPARSPGSTAGGPLAVPTSANPNAFINFMPGDARTAELLQQESDPERQGEVYRRFLLESGIGNLSSGAKEFLRGQRGEREAQYNLLGRQFDPTLNQPTSFSDFLRSDQVPTSAALQTRLRELASRQGPGPEGELIGARTEREFFQNPNVALQAALQPGRMNISPTLRDLYENIGARIAQDQRALNPELNDQFLRFAQSRGFFH